MKTFTKFLCAAALLSPAALTAATFEGKVTMTMTAAKGGTPTPINFSVKPGFSRMDMQAEGATASIILDQAKEEMIILMPEQKMYLTRAIPKPKADSAASKPSDVVVEKTSVTEKILGYTCTKYIAKEKDSTTEMWVTDELGTFIGMSNSAPMGGGRRGGAPKQAWEEALQGKDAFPLRVVSTANKGGKESFRMEATAIDKQKLPASLFAAPDDFQKLDLGGMMRGMIPGFGK